MPTAGAHYLLDAARLLRDDRTLWPYLTRPLLATLVVGGGLQGVFMLLLFLSMGPVIALVTTISPLQGLGMVLVLGLALAGLTGVILGKLGVLLGAPWYAQLAVEVEKRKLPAREIPRPEEADRAVVPAIASACAEEVKKQALVLAITLPTLALFSFLHQAWLAGLAFFALEALMLVLDFLDPSLHRRVKRLRDRLGHLRALVPRTAGFILAALFLTGIPVLNFFTVPLCTVAGTLLYCEQLHPRVRPKKRGTAKAA